MKSTTYRGGAGCGGDNSLICNEKFFQPKNPIPVNQILLMGIYVINCTE